MNPRPLSSEAAKYNRQSVTAKTDTQLRRGTKRRGKQSIGCFLRDEMPGWFPPRPPPPRARPPLRHSLFSDNSGASTGIRAFQLVLGSPRNNNNGNDGPRSRGSELPNGKRRPATTGTTATVEWRRVYSLIFSLSLAMSFFSLGLVLFLPPALSAAAKGP